LPERAKNKNQSALRDKNIIHHRGRNFKEFQNYSSVTEVTEIYFLFTFSLRGRKGKINLLCEAEKRSLRALCDTGVILKFFKITSSVVNHS